MFFKFFVLNYCLKINLVLIAFKQGKFIFIIYFTIIVMLDNNHLENTDILNLIKYESK